MEILGGLYAISFGLALYFLPTCVALGRMHHNWLAVLVLNLLGGWTCVGWVVAMVWACTETREPQE